MNYFQSQMDFGHKHRSLVAPVLNIIMVNWFTWSSSAEIAIVHKKQGGREMRRSHGFSLHKLPDGKVDII